MSTPRAFKDRRFGMFAGLREKVQTITIAAGAAGAHVISTTAKPYGITIIKSTAGVTSTGGNKIRVSLAAPQGPGIHKRIIVNPNSSAAIVIINHSSASKFFGSTVNSVSFAKTAAAKGQGNIELISVSSTGWALMTPRPSTGGSTAHPASPVPFTLLNSSR